MKINKTSAMPDLRWLPNLLLVALSSGFSACFFHSADPFTVAGFLLGPGYRRGGIGHTWQTGREIPEELYDAIDELYYEAWDYRHEETVISDLQALYAEYGVIEEPFFSIDLGLPSEDQFYEWNLANTTVDDLLLIPDDLSGFDLVPSPSEHRKVHGSLQNILTPTADATKFILREGDFWNTEVWCSDERILGGNEEACAYLGDQTDDQILFAIVDETTLR